MAYKRHNVGHLIIRALQLLGGNASRDAIKKAIIEDDANDISYEDVFVPVPTKRNGKLHIPFNLDFGFGLTNLRTCGYIEDYVRRKDITLTELGRITDYQKFPSNEDREAIKRYWKKRIQEHTDTREHNLDSVCNASSDTLDAADGSNELTMDNTSDSSEDWKIMALEQIKRFSPKKFEGFSRSLLSKIGIHFDSKRGIPMAGDHGIDGFGYIESEDLRTSKVVIQCKRYTDCPVSEPEIDKFKGAMSSNAADYGIFITTSSFTKQTIDKALQGRDIITLIDGQRLVEMIEKYQLYIEPVQTYALTDYYYQED